MFTSLMLERTFDLAVIEGYSFNPEGGGACGKECFLARMAYARTAGYSDRTIICYGMTAPKSEANPGGFTVDSMCSLIAESQALYPEMPGLAFYGHNVAVGETAILLTPPSPCRLKYLLHCRQRGVQPCSRMTVFSPTARHNPDYHAWANQSGMAELLRGISACAEKLYPDSWVPPPPENVWKPAAVLAAKTDDAAVQ